MPKPLPVPTPEIGLRGLQAMLRYRHPLAAMSVFHRELGDAFRVNLPGFTPVVLVGPQAAHFVLVDGRGDLRWRNESDPVTAVLRHGVLVEDNAAHDKLRQAMTPALHRRMLDGYLAAMSAGIERVISQPNWQDGGVVDMLVEMRKAALLILLDTLYSADFAPHLERLWQPVLKTIAYISPGAWMVWRGAPRWGYRRPMQQLDAYLYELIRARRAGLASGRSDDLVGLLLEAGLDDDLIRDQLLTMLIAGHDTSTALLAWTLYLLGRHPAALAQAAAEVRQAGEGPEALKSLPYLEAVLRESLRLYPPIHLGSRLAARELEFNGYTIPAGERVIYSIYLTQRHPAHWPNPDDFMPERHLDAPAPAPYTWLAFGGGPRNCIGAAYGQVEAKVVLAAILRRYDLSLVEPHVHPHMGATLEPRPGVRMRLMPRPRPAHEFGR